MLESRCVERSLLTYERETRHGELVDVAADQGPAVWQGLDVVEVCHHDLK